MCPHWRGRREGGKVERSKGSRKTRVGEMGRGHGKIEEGGGKERVRGDTIINNSSNTDCNTPMQSVTAGSETTIVI